MSWLQRLSNTLRPRHRDIDRELSFHIAERADQLRADGLSDSEATRRARMQFGNPVVQGELTRDVDIAARVDAFFRNVRYAVRSLIRTPGFTATVVLTLALGIGATTTIFSVVNGVLIQPLSYPQPDRLVGVWHSAQFQGVTSSNIRLSSTMYLTYGEQNQTFQAFGLWHTESANVTGRGEPEEVRTLVVTHGTLPAVGVAPGLGRWFSVADDTPGTTETVILMHEYWQRRFGANRGVIGQSLTIDSRPREVIGVMPEGFRFLNSDLDVILPQRFEGNQLQRNDVHAYVGIARLKPGISLAQANDDVRRMLPIWIDQYGTNSSALRAARLRADSSAREAGCRRRHWAGAMGVDGNHRHRAADCVRQRRQSVAGAG